MEQSKLYQIKNITEHEYTLVGCDGSVITRPIQDVDKSASVFTIQDAKNGDVLATDDWVFIFKELNSNGKPVCYCHYDIELGFHIDTDTYMSTGSDIYPATEEQRSILFAKIKEAGYEWDAEKKELPKSNTDFSDLRTWKYIVDAVWTEKEGIGQYLDSPFTEEVAKKLQKRFGNIEQKPTWSEEDEELYREALVAFATLYNELEPAADWGKLYSWLKSLKGRVQPQSKQEWSEDDEKHIMAIDLAVNRCAGKWHCCGEKCPIFEHILWLKSLSPKSQWKPSKEQIEALESATENCAYSEYQDCLRELIGQLKKLREE